MFEKLWGQQHKVAKNVDICVVPLFLESERETFRGIVTKDKFPAKIFRE
jgi:hypothetical protein